MSTPDNASPSNEAVQEPLANALNIVSELDRRIANRDISQRVAVVDFIHAHILAAEVLSLQAENARLESERELYARDAGLLAATLHLSAHQLGCEDHMVDHAVKDMKAALKSAGDALEDALSGIRYIKLNHGEMYGFGWNRLPQWDAALAEIRQLLPKPDGSNGAGEEPL